MKKITMQRRRRALRRDLTFTLTKNGKPIAKIVPCDPHAVEYTVVDRWGRFHGPVPVTFRAKL